MSSEFRISELIHHRTIRTVSQLSCLICIFPSVLFVGNSDQAHAMQHLNLFELTHGQAYRNFRKLLQWLMGKFRVIIMHQFHLIHSNMISYPPFKFSVYYSPQNIVKTMLWCFPLQFKQTKLLLMLYSRLLTVQFTDELCLWGK